MSHKKHHWVLRIAISESCKPNIMCHPVSHSLHTYASWQALHQAHLPTLYYWRYTHRKRFEVLQFQHPYPQPSVEMAKQRLPCPMLITKVPSVSTRIFLCKFVVNYDSKQQAAVFYDAAICFVADEFVVKRTGCK